MDQLTTAKQIVDALDKLIFELGPDTPIVLHAMNGGYDDRVSIDILRIARDKRHPDDDEDSFGPHEEFNIVEHDKPQEVIRIFVPTHDHRTIDG